MKLEDAMAIRNDFYEESVHSADDEFAFTEALGELIESTGEPKYMAELAWFYCERKRFDLEQKYLELAAECGYGPAFEELGYMFYFGQNGVKDYKRAFECYTRGAQPDRFGNEGSLWCRYKIADMYRFGCYVEKSEEKYREIIEEAYELVKNPRFLGDPFPEIAYRLAGIRADQGRTEEAVELLRRAKSFLAERLSYEPFWGHLEVMGRIVQLLYRLTPWDGDEADFYDLFYLTQKPGRYAFNRRRKQYLLEVTGAEDGSGIGKMKDGSQAHDDTPAIRFGGKFYRDFADFCSKVTLDGQKVTALYDEFYEIEEI